MVYETEKVSYCRLSRERTAAGRSGPNSSLEEKIVRFRAERDILKKRCISKCSRTGSSANSSHLVSLGRSIKYVTSII